MPDLELDLGRRLGRSLRTRRHSQPLAMSPSHRQLVPAGQGSLLSSTSFAEEGGQGELVLMIWSRPDGGGYLLLGERTGEAGGLC